MPRLPPAAVRARIGASGFVYQQTLSRMLRRHRSLIAVWVVKPSVQRLSGDECPGRVMVLSAVGSLIAVWVVKPSVQRLSGDECPGRVMVLSAVGVSRRMMVSEAPAS